MASDVIEFFGNLIRFLALIVFLPLIIMALFELEWWLSFILGIILFSIYVSPKAFIGSFIAGRYIGKM